MEAILVEKPQSGIAVVTLNRPRKRNAVNSTMWRDLRSIFEDLGGSRDVRVVILTGAGGHFSAGADISEFDTVRKDAETGMVYEGRIDRCYTTLAGLPKPTVAAISGYCVGGGCALALCCDFRVADGSARFGIPAAKLGVIYSVQECRALMSVVGYTKAKRILFTGDIMDAAEAQHMGLVDAVADGDVVTAAIEFAAGMTRNAPLSIAGMKLVLQSIARGETEQNAEAIDEMVARSMNSNDVREGEMAFAEKREPKFTGT
jgi:enoyl-CoA hydratase/carnithine racemase